MALINERTLLALLAMAPVGLNILFFLFILYFWTIEQIGEYTFFNLMIFFSSFATPLWQILQLQDSNISFTNRHRIVSGSIKVSVILYFLGLLTILAVNGFHLLHVALIPIGIADHLTQRHLVFLIGNNQVILSQSLTVLSQVIMYLVLLLTILQIDILTLFLIGKLIVGSLIILAFKVTKIITDEQADGGEAVDWTTKRKIEIQIKSSFTKLSQQLEKSIMIFFGYDDLGVLAILIKPYEIVGALYRTFVSLEIRRNLTLLNLQFITYLRGISALSILSVGIGVFLICYFKLGENLNFAIIICVLFAVATAFANYSTVSSYLNIYLFSGQSHVNAVLIAAVTKAMLALPFYVLFDFKGLISALVISLFLQSVYMGKQKKLRTYFET